MNLSIIIINYYSKQLLVQLLDSFRKYYTRDDYEIIIVNNSPDENITDLGTEIIKVVNLDKNYGFGAANNIGINMSQGEYILLLNSDTVFIEDCITPLITIMKKEKKAALISCKLLNEDLSHQYSIFDFDNLWNVFGENFFLYRIFINNRKFNKYIKNHNLPGDYFEIDSMMGAFILGRAGILKNYLFDERFFFNSEEVDLCRRIKTDGYIILFSPNQNIIHLGGGSASHQSWISHKYVTISKIKYFKKHFKGITKYLLITILFFGNFMRSILNLLLAIIKLDNNYLKKSFCFFRRLFLSEKS